jgi:plastocyanin
MPTRHHRRFLGVCGCVATMCLGLVTGPAWSQQTPVTVQVEVVRRSPAKHPAGNTPDNSNVVVWLQPIHDSADPIAPASPRPRAKQAPQLVQRNKSFEPHVLVIEVGSVVQFPNKDPFFHNVFSLFDGKRFDLGLYEGGSSSTARFERPGVSFLFCNIHPEMSAIVVAVQTPYFGVSDRSGHLTIPNVPDGRYAMHVWYERSSPEELKTLDRVVDIPESVHSLEPVKVTDTGDFNLTHKNKYGQDYPPQITPAYKHP